MFSTSWGDTTSPHLWGSNHRWLRTRTPGEKLVSPRSLGVNDSQLQLLRILRVARLIRLGRLDPWWRRSQDFPSYTPAIWHSNGKSTIWRCISYSRWGFSIAMFVYRRVTIGRLLFKGMPRNWNMNFSAVLVANILGSIPFAFLGKTVVLNGRIGKKKPGGVKITWDHAWMPTSNKFFSWWGMRNSKPASKPAVI